MRACTIYGLRERGSTEFRYIGRTAFSAEKRLAGHIMHASYQARLLPRSTDLACWLLSADVEAVTLTHCKETAEGRAAERARVLLCVEAGHRLFNRWLVPAEHRAPKFGIAA